MIRHKDEPAAWYIALGPIGDSACAAWPCREVLVCGDGNMHCFYEPMLQGRPSFLPVCCLAGWEAFTFEWRSPAWVARQWPMVAKKTGVFAVRASRTASLFTTAAENAFWDMSLPTLMVLAERLDVDCKSSDLFGVTMTLLEKALPGRSEEDLLTIAAKRMVAMKKSRKQGFADLLDLEEAHEFLDQDDVKAMRTDQEEKRNLGMEQKEFRRRAVARRKTLKLKVADGKVKPAKKAKTSAVPAPRRLVPKEETIKQATAETLAPPGAYIWVSRRGGSWNGKLPPFGSHSCAWSEHGERGSLIEVLKCVWEDYADLRCMSLEDMAAPEGLFAEPNSAELVADAAAGPSGS